MSVSREIYEQIEKDRSQYAEYRWQKSIIGGDPCPEEIVKTFKEMFGYEILYTAGGIIIEGVIRLDGGKKYDTGEMAKRIL